MNPSKIMTVYCGTKCNDFLGYVHKDIPASLVCKDCSLRFDYNSKADSFTATSLDPKGSIKDRPVTVHQSPIKSSRKSCLPNIHLVAMQNTAVSRKGHIIDDLLAGIDTVEKFNAFFGNNGSVESQAKYIFKNDAAIQKAFKEESRFLAFYKADLKSRIKVCSG